MKKIYLDFNATTPLDPRVFEKMHPYFVEEFGNPASTSHPWGWSAQKAVSEARLKISQMIHSRPEEVTFTAGATEATFIALMGVFYDQTLNKKTKVPPHFITSNTEHSSVTECFKLIQKLGGTVTFVPVDSMGQVQPEVIHKALRPETVLVSVIWVNNEIGTINPVSKIAKVLQGTDILFHTDATQSLGKIPVDVQECGAHLMSMSAHKLYGPKGIGALYTRKQNPRVSLYPVLVGGGQEQLRSGTQNVPGIVGFGEACAIAHAEMETEHSRSWKLHHRLLNGLKEIFPDLVLNGHPTERSPVNINLTLPSLNLDLATTALLGMAYSRGSACHAGDVQKSTVLKAIGIQDALAERTLRLSFGKMTSENDIDTALDIFKKAAIFSRDVSCDKI